MGPSTKELIQPNADPLSEEVAFLSCPGASSCSQCVVMPAVAMPPVSSSLSSVPPTTATIAATTAATMAATVTSGNARRGAVSGASGEAVSGMMGGRSGAGGITAQPYKPAQAAIGQTMMCADAWAQRICSLASTEQGAQGGGEPYGRFAHYQQCNCPVSAMYKHAYVRRCLKRGVDGWMDGWMDS